ncbi:MAG: hypothetical protein G01um101424_82 [Parcubacteria group bacterium Gr01-1014_24]|nr:MAG: hypothetical protein G01um101424_82 [Parcubacteria group bacterium Gr01-1014_24]
MRKRRHRHLAAMSVLRDYPGLYAIRPRWHSIVTPVRVLHLNKHSEETRQIFRDDPLPDDIAVWVNVSSENGDCEEMIQLQETAGKSLRYVILKAKDLRFVRSDGYEIRYAVLVKKLACVVLAPPGVTWEFFLQHSFPHESTTSGGLNA